MIMWIINSDMELLMGDELRGSARDEIVVLDVAQVEIAGGDLNPVVAYLSGLRSEHSRRNLRRQRFQHRQMAQPCRRLRKQGIYPP